MREHLEQVEKSTGKTPDQLKTGILPIEVRHIWETYIDLRGTQTAEQLITYTEIKAYCDLQCIRLTGFELKCIQLLEVEFFKATNG